VVYEDDIALNAVNAVLAYDEDTAFGNPIGFTIIVGVVIYLLY